MTDERRAAYREAFSAARKRAEREGLTIHHCRWHDSDLDVLAMPKGTVPPPGDVEQGCLL